jgi:hypothetical protein
MSSKRIILISLVIAVTLWCAAFLRCAHSETVMSKEAICKFAGRVLANALYWKDEETWSNNATIYSILNALVGKEVTFDVVYNSKYKTYYFLFETLKDEYSFLKADAKQHRGKLYFLGFTRSGFRTNGLLPNECVVYRGLKVVIPKDYKSIALRNCKLENGQKMELIEKLKNAMAEDAGYRRGEKYCFFVGPFDAKCEFNAYIRIYCENSNVLYKWPILSVLYEFDGDCSYGMVFSFDQIEKVKMNKEYIPNIQCVENIRRDGTKMFIER